MTRAAGNDAGSPAFERGAGAATLRIATNVPRPALNAAASSSIESVQQPQWIANAGELRPDTLGHGGRRSDAMPPSVLPKSHQLLNGWATIVKAADTAK